MPTLQFTLDYFKTLSCRSARAGMMSLGRGGSQRRSRHWRRAVRSCQRWCQLVCKSQAPTTCASCCFSGYPGGRTARKSWQLSGRRVIPVGSNRGQRGSLRPTGIDSKQGTALAPLCSSASKGWTWIGYLGMSIWAPAVFQPGQVGTCLLELGSTWVWASGSMSDISFVLKQEILFPWDLLLRYRSCDILHSQTWGNKIYWVNSPTFFFFKLHDILKLHPMRKTKIFSS